MSGYDVTTRSKQGQWVNEIDGAPERSQSFRSKEEAVTAGRKFAAEHGTGHVIEERLPTGDITDEGDVPGRQ